MNPNSSSLLLFCASGLSALLLIKRKNLFSSRVGEQGYFLLCGFVSCFLVPAFFWNAGLSSALNDVNNPFLTGTGGYYGMNYKYYPNALFVYLAVPFLAIGSTLLIRPMQNYTFSRDILLRLGRQLHVGRIAMLALVGTVALTLWYFFVVGWDRFWLSDMTRFEFTDEAKGDLSMKIVSALILAFGCAGAALAVFKGHFFTSLITVAIAALPSCAFASRGITVLVAAFCVAVFLRVTGKFRWPAGFLLIACVYLALQVPLAMRARGQTGVRVALGVLVDSFNDDNSDTRNTFVSHLAGSLQNIGQGFGLMVEERELSATGNRITEGVPLTFYLLSISPTFSAMDNFDQKWIQYHPRFNFYSPYSGFCEVTSLSLVLGLIFPVALYLLAAWLCRATSGQSLLLDAGLFGFALIIILAFLQFQQYSLRTTMRFIYAGFVLFGALKLLGFATNLPYASEAFRGTFALFIHSKHRRQKAESEKVTSRL